MTRAEAYELAKTRGFDKSIAVFGAKFSSDPDVVICGIQRQGRGVYIDVLEQDSTFSTEETHFQEDSVKLDSSQPKQPLLVKSPCPDEESEKPTNTIDAIDKNKAKSDRNQNSKNQDESSEPRQQRIRRKLYTANGSHQAICRFQGILMPKGEEEKGFKLLLPGLEIEATFAFPKTGWYYRKNPQAFEGVKNYLGYPRITGEGKIVKIFIVSVDQNQNFQKEQWEFIGMWCGPQKALFVQRRSDMFPDDPRPHYYKYRFKNQDEYRKYLWDRYAYQIIAKREGDELLIVRNNPFACPRRKPEPPTRGGGGGRFQDRGKFQNRETPQTLAKPQLSKHPRSKGGVEPNNN